MWDPTIIETEMWRFAFAFIFQVCILLLMDRVIWNM